MKKKFYWNICKIAKSKDKIIYTTSIEKEVLPILQSLRKVFPNKEWYVDIKTI